MLVLRSWILDQLNQNNPLIDIFLYSHHFSAWYCTDIVERNSVLVTYGVKGSSEPRVMWSFSLFTCLPASCSSRSLTISSGIWRTTLLLFARISWTTGNVRHFNNSDYFFLIPWQYLLKEQKVWSEYFGKISEQPHTIVKQR